MRELDLITAMLSYQRPEGSPAQRRFIRRFLLPLPGARQDTAGNVWLQIGSSPSTLFSAHTDTVHAESGRQRVQISASGIISLAPEFARNKFGDCLGADNAAGCYVLMALIRAKVPGLYVFHAAEECGGWGSKYFASTVNKNEFARAVAFDRRGTSDVITQMFCGVTASDEFALALADHLPGRYAPCPRGSFTDTANYRDVVSECTNVSVGYYNEHGPNEKLDSEHLFALAEAAAHVPWNSLPTVRPCEPDRYEFEPESFASDVAQDFDRCEICGEFFSYEFLSAEIVCEDCRRFFTDLDESCAY